MTLAASSRSSLNDGVRNSPGTVSGRYSPPVAQAHISRCCSSVSGERLGRRACHVEGPQFVSALHYRRERRAPQASSQSPFRFARYRPAMDVRRGAGRNIHLELGEKRLKISGPRHPQVRYRHPLVPTATCRSLASSLSMSSYGNNSPSSVRSKKERMPASSKASSLRRALGALAAPASSPASNNPSTTQYESGIGVCIVSGEEGWLSFFQMMPTESSCPPPYGMRGCGTAGWCPTPTGAFCESPRFPARAERRARNARH